MWYGRAPKHVMFHIDHKIMPKNIYSGEWVQGGDEPCWINMWLRETIICLKSKMSIWESQYPLEINIMPHINQKSN